MALELDNSGDKKSEIKFFSASYLNNKTQQEDEIYMVGLQPVMMYNIS